ncbi:IS1595 family transposase [Hyphomicrobium sp. DY-1]|uniref:IS1595 family transposase n=1 Tax=Hyphomicrobium sp. DY-1 TaxID=3075650 RepID=UPI0039C4905F
MVRDLPFPRSLPEFQRLFPDDGACAAYLEKIRWPRGFICPKCGDSQEPYRFANRPHVLRCRVCKEDTALTADTVMARTRTPLSTWFWGAYLISSLTPGMSAVQFQRQLGISRYETAFQLLHKLRAGMVRPERDRIGNVGDHVEIDETWVGGKTRGKGRGVHSQTLVIGAVEVRHKEPKEGGKAKVRRGGRYAGRLRLEVVPSRTAEVLCGFIESAVVPGTFVVTDDWGAYGKLASSFDHLPVVEGGDPQVAEDYLPIIHLVFSNLKAWLTGVHHGVRPQHLQAYLNEFTFRFNRRFYPFNSFRSLLGIGGAVDAPTYDQLYSGEWEHPTISSRHG